VTAPATPSSPSSGAAPAPKTSVFRHPGFTAFLICRLAAVFAGQIQAVVVAWQVYDLTREPLALADAAAPAACR
jgi:hypothetical protein